MDSTPATFFQEPQSESIVRLAGLLADEREARIKSENAASEAYRKLAAEQRHGIQDRFEDMFAAAVKFLKKNGFPKSASIIAAISSIEHFDLRKADKDMLLSAAEKVEARDSATTERKQ